MIEIYNTRLTERERRRQFVMDRKLINVRKQQNLDRRRNPAERELYARLKAIARYLPQHEFEVLSDGVVTETRLRARIQVCLQPACPLKGSAKTFSPPPLPPTQPFPIPTGV